MLVKAHELDWSVHLSRQNSLDDKVSTQEMQQCSKR